MSYTKKELEIIHEIARKEADGDTKGGYSKEELDKIRKEFIKRTKR